ncbi:MAG TPA: lysylphosphatidylglycerol synthase transmembrane domain-containing protein [Kofleriaceae bacterium]|jgi:uncharacterized membrane protein YbhN (UPF0104 family)
MILVGGGALAYLMHQLGWARIRAMFEGVGWWFAVIIGLDFVAMVFDAAALRAFLGPDAAHVRYRRVFAAQLAGHAINNLTPGGVLGEATKLNLLAGRADRTRVLSSIALFNLVGLYVSVIVMVIGIPITIALVPLPDTIKLVITIGLAVLLPLVIATAVLVHRGALATLADTAARLHLISPARADAWRPKLHEIDEHLGELHGGTDPGTRAGIAWIGASKACGYIASLVLVVAVGAHLHLALVVGVVSVGVLITWISSVVPLGLGILDASNYELYDLLGASGAHGVIVTLVGRVRNLVVAIAGLAMLAAMRLADQIQRR